MAELQIIPHVRETVAQKEGKLCIVVLHVMNYECFTCTYTHTHTYKGIYQINTWA